jgi:chromosomal replication initiator protein
MMSHLRPDGLMLEQPTEASAPVFDQEITSNLNPAITREPIDPQSIIGTVADYYDLHMDDLVARTRKRSVSQPRQVAMYLLTNELKLAPTHVGRLLGGRDHSTVIHGANQINSKMQEDNDLLGEVLAILDKATEHHSRS